MDGGSWHCTEAVIETIPKEKKCKKAKWLSEEVLQILWKGSYQDRKSPFDWLTSLCLPWPIKAHDTAPHHSLLETLCPRGFRATSLLVLPPPQQTRLPCLLCRFLPSFWSHPLLSLRTFKMISSYLLALNISQPRNSLWTPALHIKLPAWKLHQNV